MKLPLAILLLAVFALHARAEDASIATTAINSLGVGLLQNSGKASDNAVLSPYSVQTALAMAYAGSDGATRDEMAKVLHFPKDDALLAASFAALRRLLGYVAADYSLNSDTNEITFITVNRIYACKGHAFQKDFLSLVDTGYDAEPVSVDFEKDPAAATTRINDEVAEATHGRLRALIPPGALNSKERLVLLNSIFFKAKWKGIGTFRDTKPASFYVRGTDKKDVATMHREVFSGYARKEGYAVAVVEYSAADLQFVILLPDERDGLPALQAKLTPQMLAECAHLDKSKLVKLWLPKFEIVPQWFSLGEELQQMGIKTAFSNLPGVANFSRMTQPGEEPLYLSTIIHETWLSLDELGTEAVADSGGGFMPAFGTGPEPPPPPSVEMHVDHPFLFAIQQIDTGACLFIGRVTNPVAPPPNSDETEPKPGQQVTFPEFFKYRKELETLASPSPSPSPSASTSP